MAGKRTGLAAARKAAGYSQESLAQAMHRERSTIARWESGESDPLPGTRPALARKLRISLERLNLLLAEGATEATPIGALPTPATDRLPVLSTENQRTAATIAASQSLLRVNEVAEAGVTAELLEEVRSEIGRLAVDYVHAPLWSLFDDLVTTRDLIFSLLDRRQRPDDARELYFLAGVSCLLLAHASHNVGNRPAAFMQLRSAGTCADMANRDPLFAWCLNTEALINEGLARPGIAIERAQQARRFGGSGETGAMLAGIEARAAARLGRGDDALAAIERFKAERDRGGHDEVTQLSGVLSFPEAKQEYYLGSIYGLLAMHGDAEQHAGTAIATYEAGLPEARSYGDEALARLDVVNARLAVGDIDGGQDALTPILELPDDLRIRQMQPAIRRTRALAATWTSKSYRARQVVEALDKQYLQREARP